MAIEVAVAGVDAVDVAADLGLVHDVVVVERGEVHQFQGDAAEQVLVGAGALAAGRRGDGEDRP